MSCRQASISQLVEHQRPVLAAEAAEHARRLPAVRHERDELFALVRRTVLARRDTHAMWQLTSTSDGADDEELAKALLRALPRTDPGGPRSRPGSLRGRTNSDRDVENP